MNRRGFLAASGGAWVTAAMAVDADDVRETDTVVRVSGVGIPCRLSRPRGAVSGAVLLLPGSLFSDVDGNYPAFGMFPHAYADVARQLSAHGVVVLRMAKIGPGTGSEVFDAALAGAHADFRMRVEVAAAALASLQEAAPRRPTIVAGHSEGALVASLLATSAAAASIDGIVSLSGPASPIFDILRGQVLASMRGTPPPDMRTFDATVAAIRAGDRLPDAARTDPATTMLASMPMASIDYLRSVDRYDPVAELARVKQRVLVVQGGRDDSVPPDHADRLAAARAGSPTRIARFPTLNHFYKESAVGLSPMQSMALTRESDPAVASTIVAWSRDDT